MRTPIRIEGSPFWAVLGRVTLVLAVIWVLPISGCNMTKPTVKRFDAYPAIRDELSPELAQLLLQDYSASATSGVDQAMREIVDLSDDPEVIDHALRFRAAAVSEIRRAALRVDPIAGALIRGCCWSNFEHSFSTGPARRLSRGRWESSIE